MTTEGEHVRFRLIAVAAALLLQTPAFAADWLLIARDEQVNVSIDRDSIRRQGAIVKTWIKWDWVAEQTIDTTEGKKPYKSEKKLLVENCAKGTSSLIQVIRYMPEVDNSIVDNFVISEKSRKFTDYIPGTLGETIYKHSCKDVKVKK